ncbi:MAG TPA: 50S ribosomal protein L1 [Candidatus Marinimicrobia bacterium]|jgi:large subunit ribosomal protein L1|nr:50S ribosomal protein L1 [Candidatus Neomarinimicrobiota bacterium]MDP6276432.1 50S ribosomal protein L1 [Candidatus Neomarinimicrobiota bacterium]MDP7216944.1 50S ribosomal protein L1 [Candidatus Neomarinimicrobiota bacterium]MDP7436858.1 50S ribosomal protein L1 [Candidatus Neomarinimicrobiota bacterium]HJL74233.1 50S ribosomal protein L1 [Candidatus Neomarinimicrobiota bacterium]|tara:strand:- start:12321 stop:13010 length:690 start_codon:yes stop_codon:yes gene_type:complete
MKKSKQRKAVEEHFDRMKEYSLEDAVKLLEELKYVNFDESIDVAINLGVDPRHAEENIRVTTSLPNGTGKEVKVLVLTRGPKEKEAQEAGADYVGNDDFLEKIKGGWADIDKIIATPDMMADLGKLGKILGPKGLMPNPKSGTVTMDVDKAVKEIKAGKVELRVDKNGIIHTICGKTSFNQNQLRENVQAIYDTIIKARPASVKGTYFKKMTLSSTMGPGIKVDLATIR